jgi:hypothetical protein
MTAHDELRKEFQTAALHLEYVEQRTAKKLGGATRTLAFQDSLAIAVAVAMAAVKHKQDAREWFPEQLLHVTDEAIVSDAVGMAAVAILARTEVEILEVAAAMLPNWTQGQRDMLKPSARSEPLEAMKLAFGFELSEVHKGTWAALCGARHAFAHRGRLSQNASPMRLVDWSLAATRLVQRVWLAHHCHVGGWRSLDGSDMLPCAAVPPPPPRVKSGAQQ